MNDVQDNALRFIEDIYGPEIVEEFYSKIKGKIKLGPRELIVKNLRETDIEVLREAIKKGSYQVDTANREIAYKLPDGSTIKTRLEDNENCFCSYKRIGQGCYNLDNCNVRKVTKEFFDK